MPLLLQKFTKMVKVIHRKKWAERSGGLKPRASIAILYEL